MELIQPIIDALTSFVLTVSRTFEIRHMIDIGILSIAFYKLLWMLRSSSSGRVFRGVLMLMIGLYVSSSFQLYAINYLLSNMLEWGLMVLVILFQPEIRRFLERMGSSSLGINFFTHTEEDTPDLEHAIIQTVEAYTDLSKDKVGALMVFERNDLLDDVIKTGTALDCRVESQLLKNLFWDKAPMHDGAVIIRDGRIAAAACMLPLSTNSNLSRDLGMRHRAGIGISEHSDAVVVLVSEETGSIAVAEGGMLKRHLTHETLERLLHNELSLESKEKSEKRTTAITGLFQKTKKESGS